MISSSDETPRPVPPRYWWLKRVLVAAGALVLLLVALRLAWGWEAQRRLDAKIAEYRAAGQPVTLDDFQRSPVPDEENAAFYLRHAIAELHAPSPDSPQFEHIASDPWRIFEHLAYAQELVESNEAALRSVRQARGASSCVWGVQVSASTRTEVYGILRGIKEIARLCDIAAICAHQRGDDAVAVEYLHDMLAAGEAAGRLGTMVSHLIRIAVDSRVAQSIEFIAPALTVEGAAAEGERRNPASRDSVRLLITTLVDDQRMSDGWRFSVESERAYILDLFRGLSEGSIPISSICWQPPKMPDGLLRDLLAPAWTLCAARSLDEFQWLVDLQTATGWRAARGRVSESPSSLAFIDPGWRYSVAEQRVFELHLRALAGRRMAGALLAIRLFQLDHGTRPAELSELAPGYVPAIPCDCFADDGRALGYRPSASIPILYSVGSDGIDNEGEDVLNDRGRKDRYASDLRLHLNRENAPRYSLDSDEQDRFDRLDERVDHEGAVQSQGGKHRKEDDPAEEP
jgi:hypothetical protein